MATFVDAVSDPVSGEIVLRLDEGGTIKEMRIPSASVGAFVLFLMDRARELSQAAGRYTEEDALQLDAVTAISFEDGSAGLLLQMESNVRFALRLDPTGAAALRLALAECDELLKPAASKDRPFH